MVKFLLRVQEAPVRFRAAPTILSFFFKKKKRWLIPVRLCGGRPARAFLAHTKKSDTCARARHRSGSGYDAVACAVFYGPDGGRPVFFPCGIPLASLDRMGHMPTKNKDVFFFENIHSPKKCPTAEARRAFESRHQKACAPFLCLFNSHWRKKI